MPPLPDPISDIAPSRPVRGAGIEIQGQMAAVEGRLSRPARGAGIEICTDVQLKSSCGRSRPARVVFTSKKCYSNLQLRKLILSGTN